jgi:hypothetical protein
MGRMIAVGPAGHRHMCFHETRGPYSEEYPRYVTYNCENPLDQWLGPTWIDGGKNINAGYANIMVTHDDRAVILYHSTAESPDRASKLAIADQGLVCSGYFSNLYDIPDKHDHSTSAGARGYWPKGSIVYDAVVDTEYIHIVETELTAGFQEQTIAYQRCVFQGANLICCSPAKDSCYTTVPGEVHSSSSREVAVIDTIMTISAVALTSPVSQKIAIVYAKNRDNFGTAVNNDVVYIESMNNGNHWLDGTDWPATRYNITNYATEVTERAYTDIAACYDYNDSLHIIWNGCFFDSVPGLVTYDANLYHWSKATGISLIATGYWEGTDPGAWNRNISKMSISASDPIHHPGGDPDSVFLFVTWTQFNPGEWSAGYKTNGDIYAAVSNDCGETWSPGYNLTNTQTPGCEPEECLSEHWSSMAEDMYDGDLHIQYVCDRDAGDIIRKKESAWTENPMMYLRVEGLSPEPHCGISYTLVDPPSFTTPPLKVPPDGYRETLIEIQGLYNMGGWFQATSDHPLVTVLGGSGYLAPGETKQVRPLVSCQGEEFIDATITITGCMDTEDETTFTIKLYAVCGEDYYECARDPATFILKDNDKLKLWVCANSMEKIWHKWIEPEENQQVVFAGGAFVATIAADDPGDTVIGRQDYSDVYTGARDTINRYCGDYGRFEPGCLLQNLHVKNTYIWKTRFPDALRWYWIDIDKQIYMFHDWPSGSGNCPDWKKDIIVKYVWIKFSRPPLWWPDPGEYPGHGDIYFGHYADIDAPFDEGCTGCNTAGYDDGREMVWLHGYHNDTLPGGHPEYEDFYVGLAFTDRSGEVVEPLGMQCVRNDSFLHPQGGWGWTTDQFYDLITTPGVNIHDPDSVVDRTVVMTSGMIPAGGVEDSTFEAEYILIEAFVQGAAGQGLTELQAHMDAARYTLMWELLDYGLISKYWVPPICGDRNADGKVDSGDIVGLIGYLFFDWGPPPWPNECRQDVTGNGIIDSGDIVRLIGYVFLGESTPPCPDHCNCPEG